MRYRGMYQPTPYPGETYPAAVNAPTVEAVQTPQVQPVAPPPPPPVTRSTVQAAPVASAPPPSPAPAWSADPTPPPPPPPPAAPVVKTTAAPPPAPAPVASVPPALSATPPAPDFDATSAQDELNAFLQQQSPNQPSQFIRQDSDAAPEKPRHPGLSISMEAPSAGPTDLSTSPAPMDTSTAGMTPPPPSPITGPLSPDGLSVPDAPEQTPLTSLSPETMEILRTLPQDLTGMPQVKPAKDVDISRASPDVELPGGQVLKSESMDMDIKLKQPKIDVSYELQQAYEALLQGHTENAISIYRDVLSADPVNETALFGLATTYHRVGLIDEARPIYGKLLALNPNHTEALNNFLALVGDESPEAALEIMARLQEKNPDYSPIPAQMSILKEKMGDMQGAIHSMRKAYSISPENLVYLYNLGILYDKKGDRDEAAAIYQQMLEAYERGQDLPAPTAEIQERLTFLLSNNP